MAELGSKADAGSHASTIINRKCWSVTSKSFSHLCSSRCCRFLRYSLFPSIFFNASMRWSRARRSMVRVASIGDRERFLYSGDGWASPLGWLARRNSLGCHNYRTTEKVPNPKSVHQKYSSFPSRVPPGYLKTVPQYSTPHNLFWYCQQIISPSIRLLPLSVVGPPMIDGPSYFNSPFSLYLCENC